MTHPSIPSLYTLAHSQRGGHETDSLLGKGLCVRERGRGCVEKCFTYHELMKLPAASRRVS